MHRFLILTFACLAALGLNAQDAASDKPLPGLPWHMMNLWWEMPATPDFQSLDIEVRVKGEVDPAKLNLYIAPIGIGEINQTKFYGGIQSNIGGYAVSPDSPTGAYHKGKGAIFSRWDHKDLDTSFVRPASNGLIEAAGYEGDFASGRRPYAWGEGTYTYSLRKLSYEKDKEGKEWTWVGAFVTDKATGHFTYISSLKFPGRTLAFWGMHSLSLRSTVARKWTSPSCLRSRSALVSRASTARLSKSRSSHSSTQHKDRSPLPS